MKTAFRFVTISAFALFSTGVLAEDLSTLEKKIEFFEKKIRPVLVEHCYECHSANAKKIRGGLLVDGAEAFRDGGDSGAGVVPGELGEGTLLEALRYESFEMPPQQKLPESVIQDFETWIASGAVDPRKESVKRPLKPEGIDLVRGRQFWSFQPINDVDVPTVKDNHWAKSDIDQFILASQAVNELVSGPDASDLTLLRRLYFDLTGLPPSAEQVQEFLDNKSASRIETVVDELLASRHFGERWGRHWLDLARYSDSTGGGRSLLYGETWRYRNYVINAFNTDKPFDNFIREQLAGDLLEVSDYRERGQQIIATGFLILGPHNYENQDKEQLRMDVVDEQIDTIGRVFLGMTIGCARCHDHKFDPIPTTDYYALAGIFRSTDSLVDGNVSRWVSTPLPQSQEEIANAKSHAERLTAKNKEVQKLKTRIEYLKLSVPAILVDNTEAKLTGNWTESRSIAGFVGENYQHSSELTASATYQIATEPGVYEVQFSYTAAPNRSKKAKITIQDSEGETILSINQQLVPAADGTFQSLGEFTATDKLTVIVQPTENSPTIIDSIRLFSREEVNDEKQSKIQKTLREATAQQKVLQDELTELKKAAPLKAPGIVSVAEMQKPEDYFVCIRGNVHNLGEPVPRGFLSVVDGPQASLIKSTSSGRLEFANWIASPDNPLTARVFVNRVWHHLFGVGLVRTVDNFGVPGEKPSHPELLDYLALDFVTNNWSVKQLIREIVLSRTYQLDSETTSSTLRDPENRFLTHQNRRRLSAESIHDTLLVTSGELDNVLVDNSIRSGTKSEYGYQFDFGKRAVYLPVFRNRLPDLFSVFDFPDPNLSQGRRTSSTISPQSLFLMNSDFVHKRAVKTAERVLAIDGEVEQRLQWLILTTLNRPPSAEELRLFTEFIGDQVNSEERWTQICQTLFGSLDFRFIE